MENKPGDGKTSPFGNGKGAPTKQAGSEMGMDFLKNPKGSMNKGNPGDPMKGKPGPVGTSVDGETFVNPQSVPAGGKGNPGMNPKTGPDKFLGAGSQGNSQKPFKLKG